MHFRFPINRRAVDEREDCAFFAEGFCVLNDHECTKISKNAIKRYDGLVLRDYLDIHRQRSQRKADLLFQWFSLAVSILALVISIVSILRSQSVEAQLQPPTKKAESAARAQATPKWLGTANAERVDKRGAARIHVPLVQRHP